MNSIITVYQIITTTCEVNNDDKPKTIQVMLTSDAPRYLSPHVKHCVTYEEAINAFQKWYIKAYLRSRMLLTMPSKRFTEVF